MNLGEGGKSSDLHPLPHLHPVCYTEMFWYRRLRGYSMIVKRWVSNVERFRLLRRCSKLHSYPRRGLKRMSAYIHDKGQREGRSNIFKLNLLQGSQKRDKNGWTHFVTVDEEAESIAAKWFCRLESSRIPTLLFDHYIMRWRTGHRSWQAGLAVWANIIKMMLK